jgi:hypothetical protein
MNVLSSFFRPTSQDLRNVSISQPTEHMLAHFVYFIRNDRLICLCIRPLIIYELIYEFLPKMLHEHHVTWVHQASIWEVFE